MVYSRQLFYTLILIQVVSQAVLASASAQAEILSLPDFLKQVQSTDPGYLSQIASSASSTVMAQKANLLFRPQFFTTAQYADDTRDTSSPAIFGSSNIKRDVSAGIREQTPYGLGFQLYFDYNQSSLIGTDPALTPRPNISNIYVVPVFNFSLWQNLLGHADRANQRVTEAQELAAAYGKGYQARATLVQAEAAYWKLAVTREVVRVQNESVSRAQSILEFDTQKVKRQLVDRSDLLLVQAALKGKQLELRSMLDEERSAARALNSARGLDADEVSEQLVLPPAESLQHLSVMKRGVASGDVKSAEQASIAESAGSDLAREKFLPELSLYGSIFAWGLNFSFPLDVWTTSSLRTAYAQKAAAADLQFQKKVIDEDAQWKDLVRKFQDAQERLKIATELESVQLSKFENVRARRAKGLTIEDQVFQYELDYLNSSLARVQIEGLILGLHAQMKLMGEE